MANSFNVSALTKYVDQLSSPLIRASVVQAKTAGIITVQTGVKYKAALNILSSTLTVKAGGCTVISPDSTAVLSQREIEVCPLMVEDSVCLDVIEQYWVGQYMKTAGSYNKELPNEVYETYVADKVEKIQAAVEDILWQGDTDLPSGNRSKCNGFMKLLNANGSVIDYGLTNASPLVRVALTSNNAISTVRAMYHLLPEAVLDKNDLTLFVSSANYFTIVNALIDANNFHFTALEAIEKREFMFPGLNLKVVAIPGLAGNFQMAMGSAANFVMGTDLMNDAERFDFWYEEKDDLLYFRAKWKQGAQVAFPQEIVLYSGAPA